MTLQQQFAACAELDGKLLKGEWIANNNYCQSGVGIFDKTGCIQECPNYFSYDVLIPAIVRWCIENSDNQREDRWKKFTEAAIALLSLSLDARPTYVIRWTIQLTENQLRYVWLKAADRWIEEEQPDAMGRRGKI